MDSIFGIGFPELVFIAVIALIILGPERLPGTLREVAKYWGYLRNLSGQLTSQLSEEFKVLNDLNPKKLLNELADEEMAKEAKTKTTTPTTPAPKPATPAKPTTPAKPATSATASLAAPAKTDSEGKTEATSAANSTVATATTAAAPSNGEKPVTTVASDLPSSSPVAAMENTILPPKAPEEIPVTNTSPAATGNNGGNSAMAGGEEPAPEAVTQQPALASVTPGSVNGAKNPAEDAA